MLDAEPGGPVAPLPRSSDPHNLVEAARMSLGSQFWQLHALAAHHPSASVRQSAAAVAAMPADGSAHSLLVTPLSTSVTPVTPITPLAARVERRSQAKALIWSCKLMAVKHSG